VSTEEEARLAERVVVLLAVAAAEMAPENYRKSFKNSFSLKKSLVLFYSVLSTY